MQVKSTQLSELRYSMILPCDQKAGYDFNCLKIKCTYQKHLAMLQTKLAGVSCFPG